MLTREIGVFYVVHVFDPSSLNPVLLDEAGYRTLELFAILVRSNLLTAGTINTTTALSTPADSACMTYVRGRPHSLTEEVPLRGVKNTA